MRLSTIETSEVMRELISSETNPTLEVNLQIVQETQLLESSSRKGSDILLGEDFAAGPKDLIIREYCKDFICKYSPASSRHKRPYSKAQFPKKAANKSYESSSYLLKNKSGISRSLNFTASQVQSRFYAFFGNRSTGIHQISRQSTLLGVFIESKHSRVNENIRGDRREKIHGHDRREMPKDFLTDAGVQITREHDTSTGQASFNRKSVKVGNSRKSMFVGMISRSGSERSSEDPKISEGHQNQIRNEFEVDEDEVTETGSPFKRQGSADLLHRKRRIHNRESLGNPKGNLDESFDLDSKLKRVSSVVAKNSWQRSTLQPISTYKPSGKFKILEQTEKSDGSLSMLIIFNETTTLKFNLRPCNAETTSSQIFPEEALHDQKSPRNCSTSNLEERHSEGCKRYSIARFKSLMFAKDPIKNDLFDYTLKFIENTFWYDTLQRFLEIVDTVYSDLIQYYAKVLKEFSASSGQAKIEEIDGRAYLVVEGQIKSAKVICTTPIDSHLFGAMVKGDEGFAHLPMSANRRLLKKAPFSELNCSTVDSLVAYKYFVSSIA